MIAAADGAELLTGELQQAALLSHRRLRDSIEDRVLVDWIAIGAADPEADSLLNLARQPSPVADVGRADIGLRRQVAARDVVPDA